MRLSRLHGDEGLARTGRQREQRALRLAGLLAAGDLLQDGADGGVLVVAAGRLAAGIASQERARNRLGQAEAHALARSARAGRPGVGNSAMGAGAAGQAGEAVELDEQMAVAWRRRTARSGACRRRRPCACSRPCVGRQVLGLGLDQRHGDRLRVGVDLDAQRVVHAAPGLLARLAVDDLDGAGGFFSADQVFGPATGVDRRIDQLGSGVRFWTRFYLVLVRISSCWCAAARRMGGQGLRFRRSLPVSGQERRFRGRLHAQSIQIAHLSRWCAGHLQGALAGIAIMAFALRPPLGGLEIVVDGPDQRRPLQTRV